MKKELSRIKKKNQFFDDKDINKTNINLLDFPQTKNENFLLANENYPKNNNERSTEMHLDRYYSKQVEDDFSPQFKEEFAEHESPEFKPLYK